MCVKVGDAEAKRLWEWWHRELKDKCIHGPNCGINRR
jgi:hypothetical protein